MTRAYWRSPILTVDNEWEIEPPKSWSFVKLVFLSDGQATKGLMACKAFALKSVMAKWHAYCWIARTRAAKPEDIVCWR